MKQYYEALFLSYRPRTECSISQFCNTKCTHSIFRTIDRSTRGLLPKPLKITYIWPAGSHFCRASCGRVWMNINRVTLQHNKEFITVIFYLMVLSMCNLQTGRLEKPETGIRNRNGNGNRNRNRNRKRQRNRNSNVKGNRYKNRGIIYFKLF